MEQLVPQWSVHFCLLIGAITVSTAKKLHLLFFVSEPIVVISQIAS